MRQGRHVLLGEVGEEPFLDEVADVPLCVLDEEYLFGIHVAPR